MPDLTDPALYAQRLARQPLHGGETNDELVYLGRGDPERARCDEVDRLARIADGMVRR